MDHLLKIIIGVAILIVISLIILRLIGSKVVDAPDPRGRAYDNKYFCKEIDDLCQRAVAGTASKLTRRVAHPERKPLVSFRPDGKNDSESNSDDDSDDLAPLRRCSSVDHEVVLLVAVGRERVAGVAVFLMEEKIEYFVETIPSGVIGGKQRRDVLEMALAFYAAGVLWASEIVSCYRLDLLVSQREVAKELNDAGGDFGKVLQGFFRTTRMPCLVQWSRNFSAYTFEVEDLWEASVKATDLLVLQDDEKGLAKLHPRITMRLRLGDDVWQTMKEFIRISRSGRPEMGISNLVKLSNLQPC